MISIQKIFVILSLMFLASAKKGYSIRKPRDQVEERQLKKSKSNGGGDRYGTINDGNALGGGSGIPVNGVNRDGTIAGQLIENPNKPCVAFEYATKYITENTHQACTVEFGQMTTTSACCRLFAYNERGERKKHILYDANNQWRNLRCVCNENTAINITNGGNFGIGDAIDVGESVGSGGNGDAEEDSIIRDGDIDGGDTIIAAPASTPTLPPVSSPSPNQCSGNLSSAILALQDSPYMTNCTDSSACGNNKCCFSNYCVCWPVSQLVPGTSYCL